MKDLHLHVQVVIITSNVIISICCSAEDRTKLVRTARAARLFVLTQPINFLIFGVVSAVPAVEAVAQHL